MRHIYLMLVMASCLEPAVTRQEPIPLVVTPVTICEPAPECETVQEFQVPLPKCGNWDEGVFSSQEVRNESKAMVKKTASRMGARPSAVRVLSAMVARESSGDPCAEHTIGRSEYGIGVLGLSCEWHKDKWDGRCTAFRNPAVSTIVGLRVFRIATTRHRAKTWTEVNSVFATGKVKVRPAMDELFCTLLRKYRVDCNADPRGQLGTVLGMGPTVDQYTFLGEVLGDAG